MTKRLSPPLKWHGGKHYLAPKIVSLLPPHLHYVEPYAGGLSVLLAKDPEGVSEVVNDIDEGLTNFWRVLADGNLFPRFQRIAEATPFSECEYRDAITALTHASQPRFDYVSWAWAFFVTCRQSLAGRMRSFAPLSRNRTRRGMNEQAAAWLTAVEGLPEIHNRLKRVVILNRDALDVIRSEDGPQTLFYLDPPYVSETRTAPQVYSHEMSEKDHCELLDLIRGVQAKVLLSGYRSPLYEAWLRDWNCHDFELPNNAASGKAKRRMTESVWCNF